MPLILASASPRRADLLRAAGYAFETIAVEVDERPRPGEPPADYVRRLAMEKASAAGAVLARTAGASQDADCLILAADTAVVVDGEILGKPQDDADAALMLRRLSGREHDVLTGISLRGGEKESGGVISTVVRFTRLTDADIAWYVSTGEGRDKAGAYGIQGLASRFIPHLEGSYTNVVGLPIAATHELLQRMGSTVPLGNGDLASRVEPGYPHR